MASINLRLVMTCLFWIEEMPSWLQSSVGSWMEGGEMCVLDLVVPWPLEAIQEGSGLVLVVESLWVKAFSQRTSKRSSDCAFRTCEREANAHMSKVMG